MLFLTSLIVVTAIWLIATASHGICATRHEFEGEATTSPYFLRMTPRDLAARRFIDREYREWYQAQMLEFTWWERLWMNSVVTSAERALRDKRLSHYIPSWRFVKMPRWVEQGYPHTIGRTIVWNEQTLMLPFWTQVELAIHEAVHIWQRQNPELTYSIHRARGYDTTSLAPPSASRNNPDADDVVWKKDGHICGSQYRTDQPTSLSDVLGEDHPNESHAYEIAAFAVS